VNKARGALFPGSGDDRGGSGDIARVEAGPVNCVDHAGNVNNGVGALDQLRQAVGSVERAFDPGDVRVIGLGPAGEGAHIVAALTREPDQVATDKTGAAGDRQRRQSITI
jgi:hypothetical protein